MKQKLVIIGNGMAATRLLADLLAIDDQRFDITVVGAEAAAGYNRIMLSKLLAGDIDHQQLVTHDYDWYQTRDITLLTGSAVVSLDIPGRQLHLENGDSLGWDKLVFATGARTAIPPIPGTELSGVLAFRDLKDCEAIAGLAAEGKQFVVIGGGLLGLEAAYGINKLGAKATVVHNADWLLNRQLDRQSGEMLAASLEKSGISLVMGGRCAELVDNDQGAVQGVKLDDGRLLQCDVVVFATGIAPNKELAQFHGINSNRGIITDGWLRTDITDIFAFGECAEVDGHTIGLVEPVNQQAMILARTLCGQFPDPWAPTPIPTRLKISGEEVFSAGLVETTGADTLLWHDPVSHQYRKLLVRNQQLVGAVLYGDSEDGAWYADLMDRGVSVKPMRDKLLFGQRACEVAG